MQRVPSSDSDVAEFREPFGAFRTAATAIIVLGCGYLMYLFFMKLYAMKTPDYSGWIMFGFFLIMLTFVGVMSFHCERMVIDRRSKLLRFWKAGKIPFEAETHSLNTLVGCIISQQEKSDDDTAFTIYSVRIIFSQSAVMALETRNKLEAVVFAREVRRELGVAGDAEVIQQMSDHEALLRWLDNEDRTQK